MGMKIKKNGKIISLSESDLKRITMKLLKEQDANESMDTKGEPKEDLAQCCKDAGIDAPKYCIQGDPGKCMEELAKMVSSDPLGMGLKVVTALSCVKEKSKGGKITNYNGKLTKNTYEK
jgi:hypothetical protein